MTGLAAFFAPPPGFLPVRDRDDAVRFADGCEDADAFWARCERADWMLYLLGFTAIDAHLVLAATLPISRGQEALLEPDALTALAGLEAFLRGEPLLTLDHFEHGTGATPITDACRHFAGAAVRQALSVARHGRALGPSQPTVWSQLALYPARAANDGFKPDLGFLKTAADQLRVALPVPVLSAEPPSASDWDAFVARWP